MATNTRENGSSYARSKIKVYECIKKRVVKKSYERLYFTFIVRISDIIVGRTGGEGSGSVKLIFSFRLYSNDASD